MPWHSTFDLKEISLRGSPKRRLLLIDACKEAVVKYIKPVKDGATRWNSNEMMLRIFLQLLQVIKMFVVMEDFSSAEDKSEWYRRLNPYSRSVCTTIKTYFSFFHNLCSMSSNIIIESSAYYFLCASNMLTNKQVY